MGPSWEYHVIKLGGTFRGFKADDLEETLNQAAEDSWEPVLTNRGPADGEMIVILRRETESQSRRRRRDPGFDWP
ncbi:MAG: hypothetical protein PVF49_11195 [Anaerolineales bacterium]|jgi:hypothetical protein